MLSSPRKDSSKITANCFPLAVSQALGHAHQRGSSNQRSVTPCPLWTCRMFQKLPSWSLGNKHLTTRKLTYGTTKGEEAFQNVRLSGLASEGSDPLKVSVMGTSDPRGPTSALPRKQNAFTKACFLRSLPSWGRCCKTGSPWAGTDRC